MPLNQATDQSNPEKGGELDTQRKLEVSPTAAEIATEIEQSSNSTPYTGFTADDSPSRALRLPSLSLAQALETFSSETELQFGRYRLIRLLGQGGMGRVFLAHDTQLDRPVALKMPRMEASTGIIRDRFLREARAAATLRQPNICPIFDVGEFEGFGYLTMAFIDGEPLTRHTKHDTLLPQRQVASLVQRVAAAIHEAHEKGIVHRDLKPDNIMLDRRDEPIIMDFGLARRQQPGEETLTHEGTVMGTPAYMSPEQVEGDTKAIGPLSDVYSLGVILFELLTGRRPFEGNATVVMAKVLRDVAPSPSALRPDVEPKLEWVCWKAMAKRPSERFQSGHELYNSLRSFLDASASSLSKGMIRAQTTVIEAPKEPIETYQLKLAGPIEADVNPSAQTAVRPTKRHATTQISELLGDSALAKLLLKYSALKPEQKSQERFSIVLSKGRDELRRHVADKKHLQAIRVAAAMHVACQVQDTLTELINVATTTAIARGKMDQAKPALDVWQRLITAFPNEPALRQKAAEFAAEQAIAASKTQQHSSAVEFFRQARQWHKTDNVHKNLAAVFKRAASAAIKAKQYDLARVLCDEALEIIPDDTQFKQIRQRAVSKSQ